MNERDRFRLAKNRSTNLRQLLLRAHRAVNSAISEELAARGHRDIRPIHNQLLENLDRDGNSVTVVAKRAQMTKQAMGTLAKELEDKGYLRRVVDATDRRAWSLRFTAKGWRLMLDSFEIVSAIETAVSRRSGQAQFKAMQAGLTVVAEGSQTDLPLRPLSS